MEDGYDAHGAIKPYHIKIYYVLPYYLVDAMLTKITHFPLYVNNQDDALKFYKEKFGFKVHTDEAFGSMRWLTIQLPNQENLELIISLASTPAEKGQVGKQGAGKPYICINSTDCKGDYEKLKKAGVEFVDTPEQQPWGISATAKDLYGNLIYITQTK